MFNIRKTLRRIMVRTGSPLTTLPIFLWLTLTGITHYGIRPSYGNRINESLLASQHYNRILKYAQCGQPMARVVNINSELHPSAIKKYIPHCTIIHHCGPHSGCCRQENEQCVPKTIEEVKLYFWTIELTSRGHKKGIEVIAMKNHTECMCAPINSMSFSTTTTATIIMEYIDNKFDIDDDIFNHQCNHNNDIKYDTEFRIDLDQFGYSTTIDNDDRHCRHR
ncbi:hypothetical protein RDWZM_005129 [Blomia tropicalis]|uniref:Platelet-derived growth factor (PDGF) family profile domain-containing protein n=1 Tax=Blomia tropicalis TaxID=40697 RepID=A0A9Q0M834_BLOTA|nr:hypothetical protein RDWZM_005129 [Blomia tropicalis]